MPEQRIVITINQDGSISAKTNGFKGESCLDKLDEILDLEGGVSNLKKTDEFHQHAVIQLNRTQEIKRK